MPTTTNALDALLAIRQGGGYTDDRWNFPDPLGTPVSLTYSFLNLYYPTAIPDYYDENSLPGFKEMTPDEQSAIRDILDYISEIINVTFTEVTGIAGQMTFGTYDFTGTEDHDAYAYANFPSRWLIDYSKTDGDVWFNNACSSMMANSSPGFHFFQVALHEIGHALGLKHPFYEDKYPDFYTLDPELENFNHTVMGYHVANMYPTTYMPFDIEALQYLYGANTSTRSGDTVYNWAQNADIFETLWDGGGIDTIDCSNQTLTCWINLEDGAYSSIGLRQTVEEIVTLNRDPSSLAQYDTDGMKPGDNENYDKQQAGGLYTGENNLAIAKGVIIENAIGGSGKDFLHGNAADNILDGKGGIDGLTGGAGADIFLFSTAFAYDNVDFINDFNRGEGDKICLDGGIFTQLADGLFDSGNFGLASLNGSDYFRADAGVTALDADDYLLYDTATGYLYYDPDGNGSYRAMLFATLENLPELSADDFLCYVSTIEGATYGTKYNDIIIGNEITNNNKIIYALAGDDEINIASNSGAIGRHTVNGGSGVDTLNIDWRDHSMGIYFLVGSDTGSTYMAPTVSLDALRAALAQGNESFIYNDENTPNNDTLAYTGIEIVNIQGGYSNDLIVYQNGTNYAGNNGIDTFYADFSTWTEAVIWMNAGSNDAVTKLGAQHQVAVSGMERLLLQTGSGDDVIIQLVSGTDDDIRAGAGNDFISAGSGNDRLYGGAGNDTLDGGAGADTMVGGLGDDTYVVDNTGDVVTENTGEGTDTVNASITYTLIADVENLTLTGTGNINGTGNDLANTITGNDTDNTLEGKDGNDTLTGGAGADAFRFTTTLNTSTNVDTITDFNRWEGDKINLDSGVFTQLGGGIFNYNFRAGAGVAALDTDDYLLYDTNTGNLYYDADGKGAGAAIQFATLTNKPQDFSAIDFTNFNDSLIIGSDDDEYLYGTDNDNIIRGLAGDDGLYSYGGDDTLDGGTGNDTLFGGGGDDYLDGGDGNDFLGGGAGNDIMAGGSGNDYLNGEAGADTMTGGTGDDTYYVDDNGDVVIEKPGEGTDTVYATISYALGANVENLYLQDNGYWNDNIFFIYGGNLDGTGNELNNIIYGNLGDNVLDGGAGADTMAGGFGNDTYFVDNAGDIVVENDLAGTDTVYASISYTLTANVENLTLIGTDNINGTGNDLANSITGNAGNNILDGGTGADTMAGGLGNDTYYVDNTGDVVTENAGAGTDIVYASITYTLTANVENMVLTGSAAINGTGNDLANTIAGNAGNNILDGGTGADTMAGGLGNDTYYVDNTGDVVTENAGAGTDTVNASISYTLTANVENLTLTGSAAINGTGNDLANTITGNAGNNILDGKTGNDTLTGGAGADTFVFSTALNVTTNVGSITDFNSSEGDKISLNASVFTKLAGGIRSGNFHAGAGVMTAADADDYLIYNTTTGALYYDADGNGNGAAVQFATLTNKPQNLGAADFTGFVPDTPQPSVINGTAGNDTLTGSTGDDTINGLGGADTINGLAGDDVLNGGDGNDILNGGDGNDILEGGTGADTMSGGAGNDTYYVDNAGDVVIENAGAGTDTVYAGITYTLGANVERLILTGTGNFNGIGNALDNDLIGNYGANTLTGLAGNDVLYGGGGNDILYGGDGDDCLDGQLYPVTEFKSPNWYASVDGRAGADTMYGGNGNDYYFVDNAGDKVIEYADQGYDRVYASINYTLPNYVEFLWLMGSANISGTGNSLNNYMLGNEGNNTLSGGAGDDTLVGQGGNDTIWGGAGNDTLSGGAGADIMYGGAGNDWYSVDNAGDKVIENANEGKDRVNASVSYTLGANVEDLVLSGTAITGIGNNLNNSITGNAGDNILAGRAGNDRLNGGAGNDILKGGGGNDILTGGTGADTFVFESMLHGVDTITDFASGEDRLQLAQAELGGLLTEMRKNGGRLATNRFAANNTGVATNANQRIIYNLKTGALWYDADGSGSGVATQFATLSNKPNNLKASDFFTAAS